MPVGQDFDRETREKTRKRRIRAAQQGPLAFPLEFIDLCPRMLDGDGRLTKASR
jgi:hypothetical protein